MIQPLQNPSDGGPIYAETNLDHFIAEPWNAISSLAIVLPALYWAFYLRFQFKKYSFIYFGIPLLIAGGIGSTLYHAFRSSSFFLVMDVLPTAILTLSVGIYFWVKVLPKWWQSLFIVVPVTLGRFWLFQLLPGELAVNISYFLTGTLIFFPVLLYLIKTRLKHVIDILLSVSSLSISLVFRERDQVLTDLFPMGTHFLWHILSGVGAFYLARYLYKIRVDELNESTKNVTIKT
jgi:hypothetical protein